MLYLIPNCQNSQFLLTMTQFLSEFRLGQYVCFFPVLLVFFIAPGVTKSTVHKNVWGRYKSSLGSTD